MRLVVDATIAIEIALAGGQLGPLDGHDLVAPALLLSESISSYWIQIVTGALLVGSVLGPNIARRVTETRRRRSSQQTEEGQS